MLLAARKKGLNVTKSEVKDLVEKNGSKQLISAAQPSKGKIAAENQRQSVAG